MIDPDAVADDEEARVYLRKMAGMAGEFFAALRDSGVPEAAAVQMLVDWHAEVISDGIAWESDGDQ